MKKIILLISLISLLGGACSKQNRAINTDSQTKRGAAETDLEVKATSSSTYTQKETPATEAQTTTLGTTYFSLVFPSSWKNVYQISDFSGYGNGEGDVSEINGYAYTFFVNSNSEVIPFDEGTPMFVIMRIPKKYKNDKRIPADQQLIAEDNENVYFESLISNTGTNSFLYKKRSPQEEALLKDVQDIMKTIKILNE